MIPICGFAACALALSAAPAFADAPEQIYEPGPAKGRTSIEYDGQIGSGLPGERGHSLEAMVGVSDRLALDFEVEGEAAQGNFTAEEFAAGLTVRLSDEDAPVQLSAFGQIGIDRDGNFPHAQARLIASHEYKTWIWTGNLISRRDGEDKSLDLAYIGQARRKFGDRVGLGVEMSGQLARFAGPAGLDTAHYAGPVAALEFGDGEDGIDAELALSWLWRIDSGSDYRRTLRIEAALRF